MQHAFITRNLVVHSPAEWNDYIICWHGWMDAADVGAQENRPSYGSRYVSPSKTPSWKCFSPLVRDPRTLYGFEM